jgi:hypothetical protein
MSHARRHEPLAQSQLEAALAGGEPWSIRYVLDRCWAQERTISLPDLKPATIRTALASGTLSMREAALLGDTLSKLHSVDAVTSLQDRLEQLETLLLGAPTTIQGEAP